VPNELALIFAIVACLADIGVVVGFLATQRRNLEAQARSEGIREQRMKELEASLERAHSKIRAIDDNLLKWITDQAALAADMKNVVSTTARIESKLDNHLQKDGG
jgi:hypothetical protein